MAMIPDGSSGASIASISLLPRSSVSNRKASFGKVPEIWLELREIPILPPESDPIDEGRVPARLLFEREILNTPSSSEMPASLLVVIPYHSDSGRSEHQLSFLVHLSPSVELYRSINASRISPDWLFTAGC